MVSVEIPTRVDLQVDERLQSNGDLAPIALLSGKEKITTYDDGKIIDFTDGGKHLAATPASMSQPIHQSITLTPKIFGLQRKTFIRLLFVLLVIILGSAIGGGVGGSWAVRQKNKAESLYQPAPSTIQTTISANIPLPTQAGRYTNTGLAALQWTDLNRTLHKRVYYQDAMNKLRESAWDNSTTPRTPWRVNTISNAVKPGTPLAAAAGYPHADHSYAPVKNVYYMTKTNQLFERQAPFNDSLAWKDDNFSGLYRGSNSTFLAAYWNQDFYRRSQQLVVLFQEEGFANGITQGRYTSNNLTSNPWIDDNFGFSQHQGFTFALCPIAKRNGKQIMLYTVDSDRKLQQHEYTISEAVLDPGTVISLTRESETDLIVEPRSPLAIAIQDNQPLYTLDTFPECAKRRPLTHLIFYASRDSQRLILSAWNCSTGFLDHTPEIKPLQRPNTTYLALSAVNDRATGKGTLYVVFDPGTGPQIEEWTVPPFAGDPWVTRRTVNTNFN